MTLKRPLTSCAYCYRQSGTGAWASRGQRGQRGHLRYASSVITSSPGPSSDPLPSRPSSAASPGSRLSPQAPSETGSDGNCGSEVLGLVANDLQIETIEPEEDIPIARLRPGLDRVLFKPGVHWLNDPESGDFNFDARLRVIDQPHTFDYGALTPYKTSSKDVLLQKIAKRANTRFTGSTSSLTETLSQIYHLVSHGRLIDLDSFSSSYRNQPRTFTKLSMAPAPIILRKKSANLFAVDKVQQGDTAMEDNILMSLGKSLEKMLTLKHKDYVLYLKKNSHKLEAQKANPMPENYAYSKAGDILMRSQIDCMDERLPNKTFDLKTRAAIAIRLDMLNHKQGRNYQIIKLEGILQSFEREYYDMIRSVFLKYNFQARIGRMDGIFVAYHNTFQIFGFQYISLDEMARFLFGSAEAGNNVFRLCLLLLNKVLNRAADLYGQDQDVSVVTSFENGQLRVYLQPASVLRPSDQRLNVESVDGNLRILSFQHAAESTVAPVEMNESQLIMTELEDGLAARRLLSRLYARLHAKYKGPKMNITDQALSEIYAEVRSRTDTTGATELSSKQEETGKKEKPLESSQTIAAEVSKASKSTQSKDKGLPRKDEHTPPKTVLQLVKQQKLNAITAEDVRVIQSLRDKGYKLPTGLILILRRIAYRDKKNRYLKAATSAKTVTAPIKSGSKTVTTPPDPASKEESVATQSAPNTAALAAANKKALSQLRDKRARRASV